MAGRKSSPSADLPAGVATLAGIECSAPFDAGDAAVQAVFSSLAAFLVARVSAGDRLCVALSGGRDSLVLLDALQRLALPNALSALHVNHGLSPHAADWARFCADFCTARAIPLQVIELAPIASDGEGLEAAARRQRYAAFARCAADWLALAHHRDDQAETLLLRLLRGAGVAGAGGMPAERALHADPAPAGGSPARAPRLIRPLLDLPRATLTAYAEHFGLRWIEDESNADCRHRRNFIRHRILPPLLSVFPGGSAALARATGHFAEAALLLDELAALDRARLAPSGGRLSLAALNSLSDARARNLLRHEMRCAGLPAADARWLEEARRQLASTRAMAETCVALPAGSLRVFRGELYVLPRLPPLPSALPWSFNGDAVLDWGGRRLLVRRTIGAGISLARLAEGAAHFALRCGGERLQPDARRPRRSLKNLLQEQAVPPWQRERLPLLWCGGQLVWAAGIGVDAAFACTAGEAGVQLDWEGLSSAAVVASPLASSSAN
ncbi:tRNA lysidine(34) synthetase TilS [Rhodocyclus tenuis]|uniref:tRNA lysidine(34) synthetase TilS n=1 Tax=Rhodocyclus tenuis TaxID=1066 RepID=UPI0019087249|nr:tRNA lysidine(34) synthetase TilS [Rhodocyclus tenuis]MBK1679733.1 tRNA lysidine(34) synthetase TilS [Rhodocyclus tenuis]